MNDTNEKMLIAIVQSQDVDLLEKAFADLNITINKMPSVGGFLGRKNMTLLIRTTEQTHQLILDVLHDTCQQRIEYIAIPMESTVVPLPTPTPITVGGGTIFGIEIEHYEEF